MIGEARRACILAVGRGVKRMVRKIAALGGILFLGIILAGPLCDLPAQEKAEQPASLQYEVSVILKLIHVYVTDKNGKPVVDLTKDDFVMTDNGQPVTLTDFEKHVLGPPAGKPLTAGALAPTLPAAPAAQPAPAVSAVKAEASQAPKQPAQSLMNRKIFLFFDFAYNNARGIQKAKKAALHFIDTSVGADDEVAVLTYSSLKGLTVDEYLTRDRDKVRKALDKIDRKAASGQAPDVEDKYWRLVELGGGEDPSYLWAVRGDREDSRRIAETFVLRLTALAKALRLIPGQKQFILFSTGMPNSLVYGYQIKNPAFRGNPSDAAGDRVLRTHNEEMNKEFAASGCSFYTFDTRESAMAAPLFLFDEMTMSTGSRTSMFGPGGASQGASSVFRDNETTGQNVLKRLSDTTGGKYYSNINFFDKNMDEVQSVTGSFYVLGYSISQEYDGRFHEVKVRVKRPGCIVKAQTGYFAPKPYAEYSDLEKRLHLFDLALNESSPFRMPANFAAAALCFPLGSETRSEVLARIPAEITRQFTGNKVEFYTIAFNANGDISEVRRCEADLRPHHGKALLYSAGLALGPGEYDCRLVIRDMQTGMSAVASTKAAVSQPASSNLILSTPLLLVEEPGMAVLDAGPGKKGDPLGWRDAYSFDMLTHSAAIGPISRIHKKIEALVPYACTGSGQATVKLMASIVNQKTGKRMPVEVGLTGRTQGETMETARFELSTEGLRPGRYLLYVYAEDPVSRTLAHTQTSFTISD
jgi:VWFA-related protein